MSIMSTAPERGEAAEYYFKYIDLVPPGDIRHTLDAQSDEILALLSGISSERSDFRYAPDKWTIREVVSHITDTERVFVFRAFWFARGFDTELPSFDEKIAGAGAAADQRTWQSLIDEFRAVRAASIALFLGLPPAAWTRRGIASGNPFSVRALAYLTAGHVAHHAAIIRDRYLA
jgi:hypothetical protein